MKPEPLESDGLWMWVCTNLVTRPEHVYYGIFRELCGGEFGEPPDSTARVRYYPSREGAIAALEEAVAEYEHEEMQQDIGKGAPFNLND